MTIGVLGRREALAAGIAAVGLPRFSRAAEADAITIGVLTDQTGPYADSGGAGSVRPNPRAADESGVGRRSTRRLAVADRRPAPGSGRGRLGDRGRLAPLVFAEPPVDRERPGPHSPRRRPPST